MQLIEFWTNQFKEIEDLLKTKSSGSRLNVGIAGTKREIEEVESPAKAVGKRVKFETTEVHYTMTVKRAIQYDENDPEENVEQKGTSGLQRDGNQERIVKQESNGDEESHVKQESIR
jgi:hypothetical protein